MLELSLSLARWDEVLAGQCLAENQGTQALSLRDGCFPHMEEERAVPFPRATRGRSSANSHTQAGGPLVALKYLSLPLPRDGFDPGLSDSLDQKKPYVLEAGDQRGGLLQEEHLANEF